jgi:riboflavin synthase
MFTGIVETVGRVTEIDARPEGVRLAIASSLPASEMRRGESVAVDGVCLTVVGCEGDRFSADAIPETLRCTTLGALRPGDGVNLERALRLGDRLGGHLVQGHVDITAPVREVRRDGGEWRLVVGLPPEVARYVAHKGSITLQGVSLTVADRTSAAFEVALIPETLERTTLGRLRPGDRVNLEVDLLARYLETLVRPGPADARGQARHG